VRALGPVPQSAAELTAYRSKLERVSRALDLAHETYAAGLAERDEVVGLVGAVGAMAASATLAPDVTDDVTELRRRLDETLAARPLPIARARALAAAFSAYVDTATRPQPRAGRPISSAPASSAPASSAPASRPAPRPQRPRP